MPDVCRLSRTRAFLRGRWTLPALLAGLILSGCDYEEREVEIGYLGEAKRNPFLAAQRLCEEYGVAAETRLSLVDLPDYSTILFLASDAVNSGGFAELIATWVAEGGSIVYLLEGGSRFRDEFEDGFKSAPAAEDRETDYLLELLEVTVATGEGSPRISLGGETFEVDIPGNTVFETNWVEPGQGLAELQGKVLQFSYGNGEVSLISDAHPLRNRQIGEKDHAAFFWNLVDSSGSSSVMFVLGGKISFLGLLWSRGWMVVVPVMLAVAVWLWKSSPRHGPPLPDEKVSKRDFSRHVDALGHFLWRQRAGEQLLAPARRRVRLRLRSLMGGGESELAEGEGRSWEALAERAGLSLDRVRQALTSDPGKEPARFVQISRDLHTLDNSL